MNPNTILPDLEQLALASVTFFGRYFPHTYSGLGLNNQDDEARRKQETRDEVAGWIIYRVPPLKAGTSHVA